MTPRDMHDHGGRFEGLYRATREDLLRYLLRRCHNADEAADLLAETYLTAWRKLDVIPAGDAAQLWLYGIARNLLLRSARRQRVTHAVVERLAAELRNAEPATQHEDPRTGLLQLALADLSDQDREIPTLNAWEGLAPRQIARVLGTTANSVRIRLHRARTRIRRRLDEQADALGPRPRSQPPSFTSALARDNAQSKI
ncbi:MAG: RNA polymerase sigma factor [Trebonia sp.]